MILYFHIWGVIQIRLPTVYLHCSCFDNVAFVARVVHIVKQVYCIVIFKMWTGHDLCLNISYWFMFHTDTNFLPNQSGSPQVASNWYWPVPKVTGNASYELKNICK